MIGNAEDVALKAFALGLRPDPDVTVSKWAEKFRMLSPKAASEPGQWRNDRTPYLAEIMDALSADSPYESVDFMKGAQIGGSESGFNWIGYVMHHAPGPMMMVQPTIDLAKRASRQRIEPMIQDCPVLKDLVAVQKSRDRSNTTLQKDFPGGFLVLSGANSAPSLRSMPVKFLMLDEVDAYPGDVGGEGSPVELAEARTRTFARKKIFRISTPTIKGQSRIATSFRQSDMRYFFVPCPHCRAEQVIKWENIRWDKTPTGDPILPSVHLVCDSAECGKKIPEFHKTWMLENGRWIATNATDLNKKNAGFHLSALYSPLGWYSWADAVKQFYKAKDEPDKLKAFVNTVLGEEFEVKGEDTPEWKQIYHRRETYDIGTVPLAACLLTAAVDVQKDRLEVLVTAWNRREWWIIEHVVLPGDTSLPETYHQLDPWVTGAKVYPHASGRSVSVRMMGIDSGYNSNRVYEYVRSRTTSPPKIVALDGRQNLNVPIGTPKPVDIRLNGQRMKRGCKIWPVGTNMLKSDLYSRLKIDKPTDEAIAANGFPSSYVHFPMMGEEFFKQLCAEQFILTSKKRGFSKYEWVKTHPNNEILDLSVYNLAIYHACGAHRWTDQQWATLQSEVGAQALHAKPVTPITKNQASAPKPKPRKARQSSFWD